MLLIVALILSWLVVALCQNLTDGLEIDLVLHFIDVNTGDAIFDELPDKQHEIVIDSGDIIRGFNFIDYIIIKKVPSRVIRFKTCCIFLKR